MDEWYFAYGSNLLKDQMIARTGSAGDKEHPPRIAQLANHRLVFQKLDDRGLAFANIVMPGDGVLGVIYRCSEAQMAILDDYERGYARTKVKVTDQRGSSIDASVYVMHETPAASFAPPSAEYLQRIVKGAEQHGLPQHHVGRVVDTAKSGQ